MKLHKSTRNKSSKLTKRLPIERGQIILTEKSARTRRNSCVPQEASFRSKKSTGKTAKACRSFSNHTQNACFPPQILNTENSVLRKHTKNRETSLSQLSAAVAMLQGQLRLCTKEIFKLKKRHPLLDQLTGEVAARDRLILAHYERSKGSPLRVCEQICEKGLDERINDFVVSGRVSIRRLAEVVNQRGGDVDPRDVDQFLEYFPETVDAEMMRYLCSQSRRGSERCPRIAGLLRHVSMRMQMYRMPKSELGEALLGKSHHSPVQKQGLKKLLGNPPFNFHREEDLEALSKFLLQQSGGSPLKITKRLYKHTEDWVVFTDSEEAAFDTELCSLISKHRLALRRGMARFDASKTGVVSVDQFFSVLADNNIELSDDLRGFVRLMFYSYAYDLQKAHYAHLIQLYSQRADYLDEDEQARVFKDYIETIARNLLKNSRSVRSVFGEKRGFVSLDDFVRGLADIGMKEIDREPLEWLFDHEGKSAVKVEELESLFEFYGVAKEFVKTVESARSSGSFTVRYDSSTDLEG